MLGLLVSTLIPPVVGLELIGEPRPGVTATDLVLTIAEMLRAHGVVGNFVSSPACRSERLPADRATLANMSPEFDPPARSSDRPDHPGLPALHRPGC